MINFAATFVKGIRGIALVELEAWLKPEYEAEIGCDPRMIILDDTLNNGFEEWCDWLVDSWPEKPGVYIARGEVFISEDDMDYRNISLQLKGTVKPFR